MPDLSSVRRKLCPLAAGLALLSASRESGLAASDPVDFLRDVQPIFARHCLSCHGPEKQKNGFRLDVKEVALRGGDTHGIAIRPGNSAESPLIGYVSGTNPELVMPPKGERLAQPEIDVLRRWIDAGAPWSESADSVKAAPHWAFQPLERPLVPAAFAEASSGSKIKRVQRAPQPGATANPIDAFIQQKLAEKGLSLSPRADRRTLIRRLYFNLHGLPAPAAEVNAFVNDPDPRAYEKLVERLLASPRYGERWARHWLDVIAFGETHGFEVNTPRDNAWPYRDYVIRAFNEDKSYPQFIQDQLAGDLTGEDAATGFIVAKAALLPGQIGRDEESIRLARQDELNDMVLGAGSALLGLTISCARCHDHKFDPISQADYYAMQAMFAGVRHGERPLRTSDYEQRKKQADALRNELSAVEAQLTHFEPLANPQATATPEPSPKLNEEKFEPIDADAVRFSIYDANVHPALGLIEPCIDELEVFAVGEPPRNVALASAGAKASASGSQTSEHHKLEHIHDGQYGNSRSWMSNERGRGSVQIDFPRREHIDRIVWARDRKGEYTDRLPARYLIEAGVRDQTGMKWRRVAGTGKGRPAVHPRLTVERFVPVAARRVRFTVLETTSLEPCIDELEIFTAEANPRNVALAANGARASASSSLPGSAIHKLEHVNDGRYGNGRSWISNEPGQGWVEIEFPQTFSINKIVWARDREEKFTDRLPMRYRIEAAREDGAWQLVASSSDRRKYILAAKAAPAYELDDWSGAERARLESLLARHKDLNDRIRKLDFTPVVYAGRFEAKPEMTWRLHRGDPMQRREPVAPAGLEKIGPKLALAADTPEQERRLALARWIADSKNPLTARVLVNRLWHFHFGEGLVNTPSDFGRNGASPSHPELLDWLASEFIARGWSIKEMQRIICSSRTFQQAGSLSFEETPNEATLSRKSKAKLAAQWKKARSIDAGNRLLWRFPARRLEAEAIRDSILAVAGTLDLRMGGPGFSVFKPNDNYVRVYDPKEEFGPGDWRRMIYMTKVRMAQDGTFGAFDCPDAGQIQPKRPRSTTPIQALNLFNSTFVNQQAALFARRLEREAGSEIESQILLAFRSAFAREPWPEEMRASLALAREHGLTSVCRVLFNANEFVQVP
ncbi:MAG: PSD1 and planctomycete cytochrome C domain-containing protein [Verrucomicrobiota bacterium]